MTAEARPAAYRVEAALLILLAVVAAIFEAVLPNDHTYRSSSGSNLSGLSVGDVVGARWPCGSSRYSFPADLGLGGRILGGSPRRRDLAVVGPPLDVSAVWVKRVIGLPGDTTQMRAGRLVIGGAAVPCEGDALARVAVDGGPETEVPTYRETLPGGVAHTVAEVQGDAGSYDNTEAFHVPAGSHFMMSDNRDASLVSRRPPEQGGLGYVPLDNVVARVDVTLIHAARQAGR